MAERVRVEIRERPIVDRFIDIASWPTAKKTALLTGAAFLSHGFSFGLCAIAVRGLDGFDTRGYLMWVLVGLAALLLVFLASVVETVRGHEGAWTAYALVLAYGGWIAAFVQVQGGWSAATFSFFPLAVVLVALYFGERVGWFAFGAGMIMISLRDLLERAGPLNYAPLLQDRSLDVYASGRWAAASAIGIFAVFVFCFSISILVVASRRQQDLRLQRANKLVARYAPRQISQRILAGEHSPEYAPERLRLTVFFSDVVGFTQASDEMDPESLATALNTYFAEMTEIAERHGGTVDKFLGDGLMIFFGAPVATDDRSHARAAVEMALDMQQAMPALNEMWIDHGGRRSLEVRMGINTGYASVGDFGSPSRKAYSAIGVQVNLAARVQAECQPGQVLVSDSTWALVRNDFNGIDEGESTFKGLHYPVRCFIVSGRRDAPPADASDSDQRSAGGLAAGT